MPLHSIRLITSVGQAYRIPLIKLHFGRRIRLSCCLSICMHDVGVDAGSGDVDVRM